MAPLAEGRWTTWSDEDDAPHIARLDVPGNEALEADFQAGRPRRLSPDELQRSIDWTDQHPEWLQQVDVELEDIGADRHQEGDTGTPERPLNTPPEVARGPRSYFDSHTGAIVQADSAASLGGQSRDYWRLVHTDDEVGAALAEGEPAITVPPDFTLLHPSQQIGLAQQAIDRLYGEPTEDDPGGPFHRQILDLQQQWGVSPPVQGYRPLTPEEQPALPPRLPESPERSPVSPRSEAEPEGANGVVPVQYQGHAPRAPRASPSPTQPSTSFLDVEGRARDLAQIDGLDWQALSPTDQDRYWARALAEWRSGHGRAIRMFPPKATLPQPDLGSPQPPTAPTPSVPPSRSQPSELRPGRLLDPGIVVPPRRRLDMWPVPEDMVPPASDLDPDVAFPAVPRQPTPSWPLLTLGAPTEPRGLQLVGNPEVLRDPTERWGGKGPSWDPRGNPSDWEQIGPHQWRFNPQRPRAQSHDWMREALDALGRRFSDLPSYQKPYQRQLPISPGHGLPPEVPLEYAPLIPGTEDAPPWPQVPRSPSPWFTPTPQPQRWPQVTWASAESPPFPNPPAGEMGLQSDPGIVDRLWRRFTGIDPSTGMSLGMIPVTPGALGQYGSGSLIGRTGVPSLSLPALRSARNQLWLSAAKGAGQGGFEPSVALAQPLSRLTPFRPLIGLGTHYDADVVALYRQYLQAGQQGALAERLALPGGEEEFRRLMQTLSGVR